MKERGERGEWTKRGSQLGSLHYGPKQIASRLQAAFTNWARTQSRAVGILKWVPKLFSSNWKLCLYWITPLVVFNEDAGRVT